MSSDDDPELARARERIGSTLRGKYRLDTVLGVGGMAVVYAATHRNKKRFAVKMLHPELSMRQDIRERFVREGYVANTIEHPNALAVLDDDVGEDGAAFVVMELLKGLTVEELWESCGHRMPPRAVLAIAHGLLDVLASAHHKTIVHRDIKPANVFVLADGTVKVLDFGIARLRDAASTGATSTGVVLGTPAFLPPEQALAKASEIDHRTDIWAVGATMFTLLSGALVHAGENGAQLVIQTATQPARSLATVAPDVPAAVVSIVDKALAFEKANRWDSADVMRDTIERVHATLFGEPVSRASIAALMTPQRQDLAMLKTVPAVAPEAAGPSAGTPKADRRASGPTLPSLDPRPPSMSGEESPGSRQSHGPTVATQSFVNRAGGTTAQPVTGNPQQRGGITAQALAVTNDADTAGLPRSSRSGALLGVAAAAIMVLAGAAYALRAAGVIGNRQGPDPAAAGLVASAETALQPTPSAAASATTSTVEAAAATPRVVEVAVTPSDVKVDVDGASASVRGGKIEIKGTVGSVHHVRLFSGSTEAKTDVVIAEHGPLPPRLDLGISPKPAPGGAAPRVTSLRPPSAASPAAAPVAAPVAPSPVKPATAVTVDRNF